MRRSSFILGKRGGDAQRAVMLSRLGIGEEPAAPPPVRESLFNYHPPKAEPAPTPAPAPQVAEERPRLYEVPRIEEPPVAAPVLAPVVQDPPKVELVQAEIAPAPPEAAPVSAELELMRAELAAIRQQFAAAPTAAPIVPPRKRRRKRVDVIKGVRLTIWLLAIVGAALVAFNMLKTPPNAAPKQDHILAAAVGG